MLYLKMCRTFPSQDQKRVLTPQALDCSNHSGSVIQSWFRVNPELNLPTVLDCVFKCIHFF